MAITVKGDLFVPELFVDAIKAGFSGMQALWGSGAVIMNSSMPYGNDRVGDSVKVPYFGSIGEFETLAADGDALTPAKITSAEETATIVHAGKAFQISDWARWASGGGDPYEEGARQVREGFIRVVDKALIDAARATLTAMTDDNYSATTPVTLNYDQVVDGRVLFGDEDDPFALLGVHSKVKGDLLKLKSADGVPLLTDIKEGGLSRFAGIPVGVSDRLTNDGATPPKYTSILAKQGALVCWYNGTPVVETDRDILVPSTVIAVHTYFVVHRYTRLNGLTKGGIALLQHN